MTDTANAPQAAKAAEEILGDAVRDTIMKHRLFSPRERIVVAVSGGQDSVALLHILAACAEDWKLTLHVAHLDHGLRATSRQDAEFVRDLSARWHLPATIDRRDVPAICAREGWSLEDGARRLRYRFLLETARRQSAGRVALAHTADDQAETVLMRLVRGTGLLGLTGMPITRRLDGPADAPGSERAGIRLVRPLLETWRRRVSAYVGAHRLAWREDDTNADTRFTRNRIRHELLPLLERDYNPNVKTALTQLAEQSRDDYAYLQDAAARQWKRLAKVGPPAALLAARAGASAGRPACVTIAIPAFRRQPNALRRQLLRQAIRRVRGDVQRLEFRHWTEAERLFTERPVGTRLDLPGGVQLRREQGHVLCHLTPQLQ